MTRGRPGQMAEASEPADLDRLHGLPLYSWALGAEVRYVRIRAAPLQP